MCALVCMCVRISVGGRELLHYVEASSGRVRCTSSLIEWYAFLLFLNHHHTQSALVVVRNRNHQNNNDDASAVGGGGGGASAVAAAASSPIIIRDDDNDDEVEVVEVVDDTQKDKGSSRGGEGLKLVAMNWGLIPSW